MRLSRLGTDRCRPITKVFRAASELGRSILAAGQPSSCRPTTDRGCKAAIQGAAPHRRIRRRDHGRAVGDESASRNRKFESTPLQQTVRLSPESTFVGQEPRLGGAPEDPDRLKRYGDLGVSRVNISLPAAKANEVLPLLDRWASVVFAARAAPGAAIKSTLRLTRSAAKPASRSWLSSA